MNLPFNQLFTGYGWGVKHIPVGEFDGVTILDRTSADSVVKFQASEVKEVAQGATIKIGDLFEAVSDSVSEVAISPTTLTVSVTDTDSSDDATNGAITSSFVRDTENWEEGTLILSGTGTAIITIQDYYYCTPTTITVTVKSISDVFKDVLNNIPNDSVPNEVDRAEFTYLLWNLSGSPEPKTSTIYEDVSSESYAYKAICWATENGLVSGTGGNKFSPNDRLTLAAQVTIFFRHAAKINGITSNVTAAELTSMAEKLGCTTEAWYCEALAWAEKNQIISNSDSAWNGKSLEAIYVDETFVTNDYALTIIDRYYTWVADQLTTSTK